MNVLVKQILEKDRIIDDLKHKVEFLIRLNFVLLTIIVVMLLVARFKFF